MITLSSTKYWILIEVECAVQQKSLAKCSWKKSPRFMLWDSDRFGVKCWERFLLIWDCLNVKLGLQQVLISRPPTRLSRTHGRVSRRMEALNSNPKRRRRSQDARFFLQCHWQRSVRFHSHMQFMAFVSA